MLFKTNTKSSFQRTNDGRKEGNRFFNLCTSGISQNIKHPVILIFILLSLFLLLLPDHTFAMEPVTKRKELFSSSTMDFSREIIERNSLSINSSKTKLAKKVIDNYHALTNNEKKQALSIIDIHFGSLLKRANKDNWKKIGDEIRSFYKRETKESFVDYFKWKILTLKSPYSRKALIYSIGTRLGRFLSYDWNCKDTFKLLKFYDDKLIGFLSDEEKMLFFSRDIVEKYLYGEDELLTGKRTISLLFKIADDTHNTGLKFQVAKQLYFSYIMEESYISKEFEDIRRLLRLFRSLRDSGIADESLKQKIKITRFRLHRVIWNERFVNKLEKDRKKLKPEDDFHLMKNRNDTYIKLHPQSYFCRGAMLYKEIRGGDYYTYYKYKYMSCEHQFKPRKEIPGWKRFIKEYRDHPSINDAYYRLGRCYEIEGDYEKAIDCFIKVLKSPDYDLNYEARKRIIYIMDVELSSRDFERIMKKNPNIIILPELTYSYGLCLMRDGEYRKALKVFTYTIDNFSFWPEDLLIFTDCYYESEKNYLERGIKKQIKDCKVLAEIQDKIDKAETPSEKAGMIYKQGQYLFHRYLTFYNYLWGGGRVWYYLSSCGNNYSSSVPENDPLRIRRKNIEKKFFKKFYNRLQTIEIFKKIPDVAPNYPNMDKVYYSIALEYEKIDCSQDDVNELIDWQYGKAKYLKKLLDDCPYSSLADDAVLIYPDTYWYKKHKISQIDYIIRHYPFSDLGRKFFINRNIKRKMESGFLRNSINGLVDKKTLFRILAGCLRKYRVE